MRSRRPPKRSAWPTAAAVVVLPLAVAGTVPNRTPPPVAPAPKGMVWIPGGEFSMGAADPPSPDDNDAGMHATTDSRPILRVYVNDFWLVLTGSHSEACA